MSPDIHVHHSAPLNSWKKSLIQVLFLINFNMFHVGKCCMKNRKPIECNSSHLWGKYLVRLVYSLRCFLCLSSHFLYKSMDIYQLLVFNQNSGTQRFRGKTALCIYMQMLIKIYAWYVLYVYCKCRYLSFNRWCAW